MSKRIGAAILMCAVMVLVAAVPLAMAETHTVVKGPQGPRASAVTWSYSPTEYGIWTGKITNSGLRSLVVDVYDDTNGLSVQILHQRIRFAAYNANPVGVVITDGAIMAAGRLYSITVTPNGPRGSTCTVDDQFQPAVAPTAVIDASISWLTVSVSGAGSTDDGTIVSYDWAFGDGATATGITAVHEYALPGDYTITLTVTDNDGLTGQATQIVHASLPPPPTASFTVSVSGHDVTVDASASTAAGGIANYTWLWGDGSAAEVTLTPTATHTYPTVAAAAGASVAKSTIGIDSVTVDQGPPPPPYNVFGYVTDSLGFAVFGAAVTVTDLNTGAIWTTVTDDLYGFYMVDLNTNVTGWAAGDTIQVDVVKGALTGSVQGIAMSPGNEAYLLLDVTVSGTTTTTYTIWLTVTDNFGQIAVASMDVVI